MNHLRERLLEGLVIPACPLMLDQTGCWSHKHQRALLRYYIDAGAGGIAVGVHSTQFEIRDPKFGLFQPVLELAAQTVASWDSPGPPPLLIGGAIGPTKQAVREAEIARDLNYDAVLLGLGSLNEASETELLQHCQAVGEVLPLFGFYLQPAVGGRELPYRFWLRLCELDSLAAIKIAPFNRYSTNDVVRAVIAAEREDVALYTGNDDNIINDLLSPFRFNGKSRFIAGGLLGQWAVWTHCAVELLEQIKLARAHESIEASWLTRNIELTDANSAIFDSSNRFSGCISGINEVLRRQGFAPSNRCLLAEQCLSDGQIDEIDRVIAAYPHLRDDSFVAEGISSWLQTD